MSDGEAHGEFSDDDVGTNLTFDFDEIFSSPLPHLLVAVFVSHSSIMSVIILRKLLARFCTASRSERFSCRLVRSFVFILSFSDLPNENLLFLSLCCVNRCLFQSLFL